MSFRSLTRDTRRIAWVAGPRHLGEVPPRGFEPPLHGFSNHRLFRWSTAAKLRIAFVGMLGLAPSCPMATALQAASVSQPSTFPWGDRRDSHPLERGPHPRASATSASITVCPGGFAPLVFRLSAERSAIELRAGALSQAELRRTCSLGEWICTTDLVCPRHALSLTEPHPEITIRSRDEGN